jgi:hypothetical protein
MYYDVFGAKYKLNAQLQACNLNIMDADVHCIWSELQAEYPLTFLKFKYYVS